MRQWLRSQWGWEAKMAGLPGPQPFQDPDIPPCLRDTRHQSGRLASDDPAAPIRRPTSQTPAL